MSYNLTTLIDCPKVQGQLNEITDKGANPNEPAPEVAFLTSTLNSNRVLETNVSPGSGKLKTIEVVYTPRLLESGAATTLSASCDEGTNAGHLSTTYTLDETKGVEARETINIGDLKRICQGNPDYFATRVNALISQAVRKMQSTVATQMSVLGGWFAQDNGENQSMMTGNSLKTVKTKFTASIDGGKPNPEALQEIIFSAGNSGFTGTPFVFGWGEIWRYFNLMDSMGMSSDGGLDFAKYYAANSVAFLPSQKMHTALNGSNGTANKFLVVDPGSLFLLQYNKFDDPLVKNNDDSLVMDVIVDPVTGVAFNYKAYKSCTENITVVISTSFKVVGLPSDIYASGDRLRNTNGVLTFAITNS